MIQPGKLQPQQLGYWKYSLAVQQQLDYCILLIPGIKDYFNSPSTKMSISTDLVRLKGGADDVIVALQLN